jgi:hypothetical protein
MRQPPANSLWRRCWLPLLPLLSLAWPALAAQRERIPHGPFDVLVEGRRISAGGFPNTSGNPFKTTEVTFYRVLWKGQPVKVQHGAKTVTEFWSVMTLVDAPQPTLVVASTDAHYITEVGGQLQVRSFEPEPSTNGAALQWLDSEGGQPGPALKPGIQRTEGLPALAGGRYLRSRYSVLDVKTMELRPFEAWVDRRLPSPLPGLNASNQPALAFSPQRTQFVALGSSDDNRPGLLVINFSNNTRQAVPIDRTATRMRDAQDVTRAWIEHYYEWVQSPGGEGYPGVNEQLLLRRNAKPLPLQGSFVPFGGHFVEYRIEPVKESALPALREWLVRQFGGTWVNDPTPSSLPQPTVWQAPSGSGSRPLITLSPSQSRVAIYEVAGNRTADGEAWVRRIGGQLNAELREGRWDAHLAPVR